MPSSVENRAIRTFSQTDFSIEEDAVQFVESRWQRRSQNQNDLERQWSINVAYFLGFQWIRWDKSTRSVRIADNPKGRVRIVANLLQPAVIKIVTKIMRQRPTWNVLPTTTDYEDINAAQVGDRVLRHLWRDKNMDERLHDALLWMSTCGNSFIRVYWDPKLGPKLDVSKKDLGSNPSKEALRAWKKLAGRKEKARVPLGDIDYEVVSPFQVDVDPEATRMDEVKWLIQSKARSLTWVQERFPERGKMLNPGDGLGNNLTQFYQARIANHGGPTTGDQIGLSSGQTKDRYEDSVLVHDFWMNPSEKHPKGIHYVVAGGKVLNVGSGEADIPYNFRRIPFVHLQERPVPGRFWGTCGLEQALRLQSEYNRLRSQIVEHQNENVRARFLVPRGAQIREDAFNGPAGSFVYYNFPLTPTKMPQEPLPQDVIRRLETIKRDIEDVFVLHEVSNAKAQPSLRSGTAIQQLQEQDEVSLSQTAKSIENAMGTMGAWSLDIEKQFVDEPRLIRIVGRNNLIESMEFRGKDLMGNETNLPGFNKFDVTVSLGSQIPDSRAGRQQLITDLTQLGYLNPVDDKDKVLDALGMGPNDELYNMEKLQRGAQIAELSQMIKGVGVLINEYDNDIIHLDELTRFQVNPMYRGLPNSIKDLIAKHRQDHFDRLQLSQLQAQAPGVPAEQFGLTEPVTAEQQGHEEMFLEPGVVPEFGPDDLDAILAESSGRAASDVTA